MGSARREEEKREKLTEKLCVGPHACTLQGRGGAGARPRGGCVRLSGLLVVGKAGGQRLLEAGL